MITIAGQTLRHVEELTSKTQTLLALIDGAERWLAWAIPASTYFRFADEATLADGVQRGLHGDALILLPRLCLLVHPRKLWTLKEEQLNQLLAYEGDDEDNQVLATSLQSVLNDAGIFTQQNLASGRQFLEQIGKAQSPLFQSLSLADQIALMELVKAPPTSLALDRTAQAGAATFASESAQTPREFADYYAFFFEVAQRSAPGDASLDALTTARNLRDRLADSVQALLSCPVVARAPSTVDMYALVNQWVDQQQLIGFSTVASALRQLAISGPLPGTGEDDRAYNVRLRAFTESVQQFLKYTEPSARTLSQDGLTHAYTLDAKSASARLDRSRDGWVTLGGYRQTIATTPPPAPEITPSPAPAPATPPPSTKSKAK